MSPSEEKIGHLIASVEFLSKNIDQLSKQMEERVNRDEEASVARFKLNAQMESNSLKIDNLTRDMNSAKGFGLKVVLIILGASSAAGAMGSSVSGWIGNTIKAAVE